MGQKNLFVAVVLKLLYARFPICCKAQDNDGDIKSVFANKYPLTSQFRSGPRNEKSSYEIWESYQFKMDEYRVDLQTNTLRFSEKNYEYANRFAAENPEMILMSTWRAASGNPNGLSAAGNGDPLGESFIEFPGHFVLSPGTYMSSALTDANDWFSVDEGANIVVGPALLVEENVHTGRKMWENFEYVLVKARIGTLVQVERAFNGSPPPRSFPSTSNFRTYVANFPWDFRVNTDYTDWFFNYSPDCPLDANGESAADIVLRKMAVPMQPGGPLENLGGLDFGSGPLSFAPNNADYNIDGILDGDSKYWEGVINLYNDIWDILGEGRILLTEFNFDMNSFINGPNLEGLARPGDPWKEVSKTINQVLAWKIMANRPFIGLSFVQYMNNEEELKRVDYHRLLSGYSACLGLAAEADAGEGGIEVLERDELFKGAERIPHWLGKPVGQLVRSASHSKNILLSYDGVSSNDWSAMNNNLSAFRAKLVTEGDELIIRPNGRGAGFLTLSLNFKIQEKTDLTIFMEAISDDDQLVRDIKLPSISVNVDTGPVRATLTNKNYLPLSWLIRGAQPNNNVQFDLRFQPGGDIRIRNLSVHTETDAMACQFEHGVVLVNPSMEDIELDLTDMFPGRTNFKRLTASNIPEENIEGKYRPQRTLAMTINDGSVIQNEQKVLVNERNSLFLTANSINEESVPSVIDEESIFTPSTPSPTPPPTNFNIQLPVVDNDISNDEWVGTPPPTSKPCNPFMNESSGLIGSIVSFQNVDNQEKTNNIDTDENKDNNKDNTKDNNKNKNKNRNKNRNRKKKN